MPKILKFQTPSVTLPTSTPITNNFQTTVTNNASSTTLARSFIEGHRADPDAHLLSRRIKGAAPGNS